jgi:hypothetical protein
MPLRLHLLTRRLLLTLMLLTFLSPGFGWQMVASHDLLEHPGVTAGQDHPEHDDHHGHDDHEDPPATHGHEHSHEDAHSMIGHVLGHMPATTFHAALPVYVPQQPVWQRAEPLLLLPSSPPDQPYRPPQTQSV